MAFYPTAQLRWIRRVTRIGDSAWSMADQAVLSGLNFLTMFTVARWADAGELGRYAIALSLLALVVAVQDAVVTRPYAIQMLRPVGTPREHAFSALLMTFGLAAGAAALFALLAAGLQLAPAADRHAGVALALVAAMPAILLREHVRRLALANFLVVSAFMLDVSAAIMILAGLAALVLSGAPVDVSTVLFLVSASTALAALGWLILHRHLLKPQIDGLRETARQSWFLGKWLLPTKVAMQAQGYATHWVTFLIAGAATTGVYAAGLSIVALTNPFLIGYINVMTPRAVRILRDGGMVALRRKALEDAVLLGSAMAAFAVGILFAGNRIIAILYPSITHESIGHIMAVLAAASTLAAIGAPAANALASAERGKPLAAITVASCVLGVAAAAAGMWLHGLVGAAYGVLLTEALGCAARWHVLNAAVAEPATAPAPGIAEARSC